MTTKQNLAKILKKEHEQKWVALSKDQSRVVSYNKSLVTLKEQIGDKSVVYMKVPSSEVLYSY